MTRRTNYKIVEGTKDAPIRMVVKVGSHNGKYGRVSLPASMIGKIVEVVVPAEPIAPEILGKGESPAPIAKKIVAQTVTSVVEEDDKVGEEQEGGQPAEEVVDEVETAEEVKGGQE